MRTILTFDAGLPALRSSPPASRVVPLPAPSAPVLFSSATSRAPSERAWAPAVGLAGVLYLGVVLVLAHLPSSPERAPAAEPLAGPQIVFVSAPAAPAASPPAPAARRRHAPAPTRAPLALAAPGAAREVPEEPPSPEELGGSAVEVEAIAQGPALTAFDRADGSPAASSVGDRGAAQRGPLVRTRVVPDYPRHLRQLGAEGTVVLRFVVGTDGLVERQSVEVVESLPGFDESAIAALLRWRFSPAVGPGGEPLRASVEVPFVFSLR